MEPSELANLIEAELRAVSNPERAAQEKRYLKSDLEFIGAAVWQIHAVVKDRLRADALDRDQVVALVEALWGPPIHERRMAAVDVLAVNVARLDRSDLALIERLLRESRTWALVDGLAGDVVARLLLTDPQVASVLDRWAADPDFWLRRSALLAHLGRVRHGQPLGDFGRYADAMLEEKEFFVRKAIGWVLREAGKRRPGDVVAWLEPRAARASGVTMREAVKYLPADDGRRLMDAYRARSRLGIGRPAGIGRPRLGRQGQRIYSDSRRRNGSQ